MSKDKSVNRSYTITLDEDTKLRCNDCGEQADVEHWGSVVPDQRTAYLCLKHLQERQQYTAKHNKPMPMSDFPPEPNEKK